MRGSDPFENRENRIFKSANVRIQYGLKEDMGFFPNGNLKKMIEEEGDEEEEQGEGWVMMEGFVK